MPAHGAQVELEALEVHDERGRQLLDGTPPLGGDALPALLTQVAVVALYHNGSIQPAKKKTKNK